MRLIFYFITFIGMNFSYCLAQQYNYNLNFEKGTLKDGFPNGWFPLGKDKSPYEIKLDSIEKIEGQYSLFIESIQNANNNTYKCVAMKIPAIYQGDSITLKAILKAENVTAPIGLLLRLDNDFGGVLHANNMMDKNIIGSFMWQEFSVTLPLPKDSKTIIIGVILSGEGKLWADDISLLIDGTDFEKSKIKEEKIFNANSDTIQFKNGSNINILNLSKQQIDNVVILGKVWGMMKYFHPTIAEGKYNWDFELFRIFPEIIRASSKEERNSILTQWVKKYGELDLSSKNTTTSTNNLIIKMEYDLDWISNKKELGVELVEYLVKLKNVTKDSQNYYIEMSPHVGNPIFKHENSYSTMIYPDAGYRLLALFRYWNMIQYFFPYKYLIGEDWNKILPEFIPLFINAKNSLEYQTTLLKLITRINDTHAQILQANIALDTAKGIYLPPFEVDFIENKAIVTRITNTELAKNTNILKGDVILKVNGKSIRQIIKEKKIVTPASNGPTLIRNIAYDLLRSKDTLLEIEYKQNNIKYSNKINCYLPKDIYNTKPIPVQSYKMLENNIGYIYLGALKRDSIDFIMNIFKDSKGIILDIRNYPMDFPLFELGFYLMPDSIAFVNFSMGSIKWPGRFYYNPLSLKVGSKNPNYYKGQIVILIDETTQSSAEYHAMAFRRAPHSLVVGSTTAGADGNISSITLPGNIKTSISGIGVYYPDGKETQRIGIVPDIKVKQTIKGFKKGNDQILNKAIELIQKNKVYESNKKNIHSWR